jgi:hypothetical protein
VLGYSAPVALLPDGSPFTFSSRTVAGRRQQFNLHLDRVFLSATIDAVRSPSAPMLGIRRRFELDHSLVLHRRGSELTDAELGRQFEDRSLRRLYVEAIAAELGDETAHEFLARAARERVLAMVNAWRNAPIQGTVADIMLVAYADLNTRLRRYPAAVPVQTVHDSIVVECALQDSEAIVAEMRAALERASMRFCPHIVPKVDVDVRSSLSESDVVSRPR